jgi:hypothetical protein
MADKQSFRSRAAILLTVEQGAQRFANQTGIAVKLYAVMGGYEARSVDRGAPTGSVRFLRTIEKEPAKTPAPAAAPAAPTKGTPVAPKKTRAAAPTTPETKTDPGPPPADA